MALDAATLALVAKELERELEHAKIDKIFEPTRDEVVFNMRRRKIGEHTAAPRLFLSARSGSARVCLTNESFENPAVPPSFCMLLRKHYTGGKLMRVHTPENERIVFFDFLCTNEMGDTVTNTIAAELMGRYSNLVLIRDGKIIDALKRVDFEDSEVRQLLPGLAYTLPQKPDRLSFFTSDVDMLVEKIMQKSAPLQDALMKIASGVGPVICRETVYRAFGVQNIFSDNLSEEQEQALKNAIINIQDIYKSGGTPTVVINSEGKPIEFSFLPLTQYEDSAILEEYSSYSLMLEGYYAAKDKAERMAQKGRDLAKSVKNAYDRALRKQAARLEERQKSEESENFRLWGEILNANLWAFKRGDKNVTLTNYYTGEPVTIPLDIRLTPVANAQKYFKEYKKKQTAAKMLTQLLIDGENEIKYLETVLYEVSKAEGDAQLGEIRAELKSQGYLKYYKPKNKKQKPSEFIKYLSSDDFLILVGRNNTQNDMLTLKTARGRDWWFHVKNAPGSHVIVISEGREVPDTTKTQAAQIAAYHSGLGVGAKVEVDYTLVRNVRKTNDCKPGMVLYDVYETAVVVANEQEIKALKC